MDRMEMQGMEFHQAVYRGFEEIAGQNKNFIMLDVAPEIPNMKLLK